MSFQHLTPHAQHFNTSNMKIFTNPPKETWPELAQRPQLELEFLESAVRNLLNRVKKSGDSALRELTLQFDKASIQNFLVSKEEIAEAVQSIPADLQKSIRTAASNIEKFHAAQKRDSPQIETMAGRVVLEKSSAH